MDAKRRAEVAARLRRLAHEGLGLTKSMERDCLDAASELEAKPSESSMVTAHAYQPHPPDPRFCGCGVAKELHASEYPSAESSMVQRIEALDGPPDPERDREERRDMEGP